MDVVLSAYTSLAAAVAAAVLVAGYVNRLLSLDGWAARLVSWAVAAILTFAGAFFDIGFLAEKGVFECIAVGAGIALASNGLFTIDQIKTILGILKASQPAVVRATESG